MQYQMEYIYKGVFPTKKAIIGHFKNDLEPQALSVCNCASKAIIEEDSISESSIWMKPFQIKPL